MRRVRRLFSLLVDPDRLDHAATLAARGKKRRPDVAAWLFRREEHLEQLAAALADGSWRPDPVELVRIRDPKPRVISRATFGDRVIHTALVEAMKPALLRTLLPECMACLPGRGTHRAVLHLLAARRRHRYALHLDVRAYFPSIDIGILRGLLRRHIDDERFMATLDRVLDAGPEAYQRPEVRHWLHLGPAEPGRGKHAVCG